MSGTPTPPETLSGLVALIADQGRRPAVVQLQRDGLATWSRAELADQARRLAAALHRQGLQPGQRALLFAPPSPQWIIAVLALLDIGAVPVPVDNQADDTDLAHILGDSSARWAFASERLAGRLADTAKDQDQPGLRIVRLDADDDDENGLAALIDSAPTDGESAHHDADAGDIAVLFYTSGTSGPPKGVPLTHANLLSNLGAILGEQIVAPSDRLLLPLPLHHVYPFALGFLAPLVAGIPIILPHSMTGPQLARALNEGEATAILGIPRLYTALFTAIRRRIASVGRAATATFDGLLTATAKVQDLTRLDPGRLLFKPLRDRFAPRLRLLISGGAALDLSLGRQLDALGWRIATGYGLTETSPILTMMPPGVRRFGSAGYALTGVQLRIAERENERADGEVQAKGPNVFAGWLDLPDKTREAFTDDGWFRTGDLGRLERDDAGTEWLYLAGRASTRIVLSGGENIDPERIEQRLDDCPSIRETGVLEHQGALAAVVVAEPDAARDLEGDALEQRLRDEIAQASAGAPSYQRIGKLRIDTSPLPRTRLGKLRRKRLAERFDALAETSAPQPKAGLADRQDLSPEDRQLLEDPDAERVWEWLGERFQDRHITPDTDLQLDLDVDSLEWVSLTLDLQERVGLALEEDAIARIASVRDLLREAAEGSAESAGGGADLEERLQDPESLLSDDQRRWLRPPAGLHRVLGSLVHTLSGAAMKGLFRLRVDGIEHLPSEGPCLLTPNHLSSLDPAVILALLDRQHRPGTCWGGWTGLLFHRPWTRLVSRSLRVLPVDPGKGPLSSLALGAAALQRGCMLVWFPEGKRSEDGQLQRFRPGVGTLARVQSVPMVPILIDGTDAALPPGSLRLRLRPIHVRIGAPVDPSELEQRGQGETPAERIADALRSEVSALGAALGE